MLTPDQSRAARGLLDLRLADLAERSGISISTISGFEAGALRTMPANRLILRQALEAAGAIFIESDGKFGPGVRLRHTA